LIVRLKPGWHSGYCAGLLVHTFLEKRFLQVPKTILVV